MHLNNINTAKVTVCVVSYNQQDYIAQCLQSIVDQETNFPFIVLVSDDCSTDNTSAIIQQFAAQYPDIIVPVVRQKNLGAYQNFLQTHQMATSPYICHCDGDDYWLPGKLQAQADYLDQHQKCNVVFSRTFVAYPDGRLLQDNIRPAFIPATGFSQADVLRLISIGTNSSKMYRKPSQPYPYPDLPILDYFETVEQVADGYATYVSDQIYAVYRANIGIATQGLSTRKALHQTFLYFAKRYPEHRLNINIAAMFLFLADFKNRRPTWRVGLQVFCKTFHPLVFFKAVKTWNDLQVLRNPAGE